MFNTVVPTKPDKSISTISPILLLEFFGDKGGAVYINHNSGSRLLFSECEFEFLGHLCTLLSCRLQLYGYKDKSVYH